jgi:hypothetical protein
MKSTFGGMVIDWSDEDENADDSIRVNREFDSNEIVESDSQFEKKLRTKDFNIGWNDN